MTIEEHTIKTAMTRCRMETRKELSDTTGIKDQTMRIRFRNPASFRLYELRTIARCLNLTDDELMSIVKGCELGVSRRTALNLLMEAMPKAERERMAAMFFGKEVNA